ncbi:MAG TPA: AAA family ATPase [Clostridiaceae bacterium]|nr:AAA family ATPase [Clostridiaceae bacterium]
MTDTPVKLDGTVSEIVFYAEDSGYTVAEIAGDRLFTAVGAMPKLAVGDSVSLHGQWSTHPVYGEQFKVGSVELHGPESLDAIERYLASGALKGIGPALAKRLTARFGIETLEVLRTKPRLAATVKGISARLARQIETQLAEEKGEQTLALLLMPAGISYSRIKRIYRELGIGAAEAVRQDPWIIMRLVSGIGFETANKVAAALGFSDDHPARIRSAYWQLIYSALGRGHTFVAKASLFRELSQRLSLAEEVLSHALADGVEGVREIELEGRTVCSFVSVTDMETDIARRIRLKLDGRQRHCDTAYVTAWAESAGMELSDEQTAAVAMALNHDFSVITGGPGTGKTTIIKALVELAGRQKLKMQLAAPTGRAARRLSEAAGREAMTLHRLLNVMPDDDILADATPASTPVRSDLLIIDECSMIDLNMFWRLLAALSTHTAVVLVGDADQLPSIGPGQVLRDILACPDVPRTELTRIYRQSEDNLIVLNAHRLNHGEPLIYAQKPDSPFLVTFLDDDDAMVSTLERMLTGPMRTHYHISDLRDVQILAPMHRGSAGVQNLNRRIQTLFHGGKAEGLTFGSIVFAVGDKVIQTRNNYDLLWQNTLTGEPGSGIMNGETGIIDAIDSDQRQVAVCFEHDRLTWLRDEDLPDLDLAYAMTIHKSQGSEYDTVCLVLGHAPPDFLTRNLIYTAFTRARTRLILFTGRRRFERVLKSGRIAARSTHLGRLLNEARC